jgi:hypothetical protein
MSMSSLDKAVETQLNNIQKKTGKSLDELKTLIAASGLTKHGEIRDMLKRELGLGHGDANTVVHAALQSDGTRAAAAQGLSSDQVVDEIYSGGKAPLRPIHDKLMAAINQFGDFEIAPKKGYVSLRRSKQFAMITPATKSRVEVGLNAKELEATERLIALPKGSMCHFKVNVTDPEQVDDELVGWIRAAYDASA